MIDYAIDVGHIYCSPTTASLVKQKLHVSACHIIALELERKVSTSPQKYHHLRV